MLTSSLTQPRRNRVSGQIGRIDLGDKGTLRFKELQRSIGKISQKVLTTNLRAMEQAGIVRREVFAQVPPRVEYSLTELGQSLQPVLQAMSQWGENYKKSLRDS